MNILTRLQSLINVSVDLATKLVVTENVTLGEILLRRTPYQLDGVAFLSSNNNNPEFSKN